ncbi:AMIN domain-containing protein [Methylobrevis pamukkalensis]|uniref:N-acetylmuramoyl-L-alanine amidase AmiC n=1 Tax=Methylobrevis pamukkalensis TaxID=1439726 RepID=A0A1E3H0D0_9HYPH|nr:N-acetylmuramoyl-L-alanine amidase [Methylobrevis pamukkalensis]ODN69773.1 N-acetylmuramoyl-L-alanine amidase AmiC precursor [Methylobrevis pamukkalensis]
MPIISPTLRAVLCAALIATSAAPAAAAAPAQGVVTAPEARPVARDARIVGDDKRTRFIVDLTDGVETAAFALDDPYRIVIDLPEVDFKFSDTVGGEGRGLIRSFRYGLIGRGKSRIVIDATGPVSIDKSFLLPAIEGQPARFVVDLVETTREAFLADQARNVVARKAMAEVAVAKTDRLPSGLARADRIHPLVVIDPGHGGIDPGTVAATACARRTSSLPSPRNCGARSRPRARSRCR